MRRPILIVALFAAVVGVGALMTTGPTLAADPPNTDRPRATDRRKSTPESAASRTAKSDRGDSNESNAESRTESVARLLPQRSPESSTGETSAGRKRAEPPAWWNTAGWLCGIVALILIGARVLLRNAPLLPGVLPQEAMQVLGRRMLAPRHTLHLVRCGRRLLVIGSSPTGLSSLGEVTDPDEVDHLAGLCRAARTGSVSSETNAAEAPSPVSRFAALFQRTAGIAPDDSRDFAPRDFAPGDVADEPMSTASAGTHQLRERLQAATASPTELESDYNPPQRDWPPSRRTEGRHA